MPSKAEPDKPFAHVFYFRLSDTSDELAEKFIALTKKYLSGHPGQIHFSIGRRALDIRRSVSAIDFDVSVNMIFRNYESYLDYAEDKEHEMYITEVAGMSPHRIVHDSFLDAVIDPVIEKASKK